MRRLRCRRCRIQEELARYHGVRGGGGGGVVVWYVDDRGRGRVGRARVVHGPRKQHGLGGPPSLLLDYLAVLKREGVPEIQSSPRQLAVPPLLISSDEFSPMFSSESNTMSRL